MIILDYSDRGETYTSKYKDACELLASVIENHSYIDEPTARWNVGLCTESHTQDSLLRSMRYKLAAKILLHELNIHSQKNRAEHDPAKNIVENEEGDAVKNIK
ncbi:hypothetical protein Tco_0678280 [Tanacetum coccineum]|uniref:Uncharacterized protein n=1 Tax=Tanacetum coccineum TaxID=301880 RepID=A0ABQ4XEK6_9ASTR